MPLVKQTGVGGRRNLNILCDVFLLGVLLVAGAAPGCWAKIEAQRRLLNDDFTVPTRTGHGEGSSAVGASSALEPTVPHYNLYKDDLKSISYETIHRILRDENEPTIYRANDLRYFHKRSSAAEHVVAKRSLVQAPPGIRLNLNSSNLQVFPREVLGSSRSLGDVIAINLHNNSLREFPIGALPNLTTLDLSANNFTHFEVAPGSGQLRALNLNQNRIVNFTTLTSKDSSSQRQHSSLHQLQLKDNSIRRLGQLNLSQLNELEILDLSCNQLENLETAFFPTRMKNLKHLNLARNRLQCIYRETFYNLLSMNTLILSYNEITEIDYETFLALPNLQYLDLSHNRLRGDSIRALQGIPDLVGLSIAYNGQLGSSMQEFVASWSLKELDASGTGLCKIPAALAQSVRTLKLADNWLTIISCGDLDSYPLLQYLDLSYSHIDEIEEDALGRLEILETLFLDHNHLKRIPISLPTSLENLFLQDNQIMDIQSQSFQGLNNLKTLDLSGNQLLYLPDLPLPKLLTLNLQSSGISGLHQAIVKTSPHLRDLYLEDNPIKCADLLGIAEWASPCRNDRRITERINIKSHYVRMHNYFERFECVSTDPDTCATCATDTLPRSTSASSTNRSNCVDVNQPGTTTATTTPTTKRPPSEQLTQRGRNNEPPRGEAATSAPANTKSALTRKTQAELKSTVAPGPADANHDELKSERTSNAPQTSPPAPPATELSATAATTASRIRTNSTDKISTLPQQKQLADATPSPPTSPPQIKSDNNYVETSPGISPTPRTLLQPQPLSHSQLQSTATSPIPPFGGSLLSQESTGKSHKGLKAQSDNANGIGHSKDNGEMSVPTSRAKSNLPTTAVVKQQQGPTTTEETTMASTTTVTATDTARATTTTTTMMTMIIGQQASKTELTKTPGQQHNKIQELLHTKDRHLIGTPLLMHKGHVVLVPPTVSPQGGTATNTMATTSKGNTLRLASRQDARTGSHGNGTTTITTSKEHKLEMLADDIYPHHPTPGKQQGSNENAIIKGPRKKTLTSGPLGQENHYQDIQQHKPPLALDDKKDTPTQQKPKDNSTTMAAIEKDKNQRASKERERVQQQERVQKQDKQFATKSAHHHSLNTPLDGQIPRVERDELLNEIDGWQTGAGERIPTKDTPPHHSRVNIALHAGRTAGDVQNLNIDSAPEAAQQSPTEGPSANGTSARTSAALIKSETMPRTESDLPPQQSVHQQHTVKSERWLDIRKATRHPGLVIVIGVTFATVFVVGLVQIYRYRQKPLDYITHRHYGFQNEHHQQQQYHEQDIQEHQRHHLYHHHRHGHDSHPDNGRNHNQCSSTYSASDDRYTTSPHHLLRIHEKPPSGPAAPPLLLPPPPPPPASSSPSSSSSSTSMASGCGNYDSSGCAPSNRTTTTSNYRLFQLNGRRIKHTHQSSPSPPLDDDNAFYTEMNHGPQSELASDFFPMELLSAPSRMHHHQHHLHQHQSTSPSSIVVPPLGAHALPAPPPPPPLTHGMTTVSLVGHQQQHQQPRRPAIDDDDFQDIAVARDRSKFEIW